MKTIIIEDEKLAARKLERMLTANGLEVVTLLHSVQSAVEWLQENEHPKLIFTDIQLGDGLSFDIFETIPTKSFLIFTTAFDNYTLRAFKLNSIDYLLKPIDKEELKKAIDKYNNLQLPQQEIPFQKLLKGFFTQEKIYKNRFLIKVGNHLKPILSEKITCFFSENKITYLFSEGRNYPIDSTLEELEETLDDKLFFRVSRQYIINSSYISKITNYSNSRLIVSLENYTEEIIVSRERVKDFKNWLE